MYRKINRSKLFLKDYKKLKISDQHYAKFIVSIGKLLSKESLPPQAKDHNLKGNWQGFREFHISGDLIVIYSITDDTVNLIRIGSHSELFE